MPVASVEASLASRCVSDGGCGHVVGGVVEHDHGAVADYQACERVLEILALLGPGQHLLRVHGVVAIAPAVLDIGEVDLITTKSGPVDGEVHEDAVEPRFYRCALAQLIVLGPFSERRLLDEVLDAGLVSDQPQCEPSQTWQLVRQERGGVDVGGNRPSPGRIGLGLRATVIGADGRCFEHVPELASAKAGLARRPFHSLRHAFATLQIENGEELGVVSRVLGHSQVATTADVYAHLTPAMLERTANRMDAILKRRAASRQVVRRVV